MFRSSVSVAPIVTVFLLAGSLSAAGPWDAVAERFGCSQKIQEGEQGSGRLYQMEYLPKSQTLGNHNRIFTITLTRLPEDERAANEQAEKSIRSVSQASARAATRVVEFTRSVTNHGPVAFFEYVMNGEHNLGVIARTGPGILAVYQLALLRDQAPSTEDRKCLRALIGMD